MRSWFLPRTPDVISTLLQQAQVTIAGMDAFAAWSGGDSGREREVRDAEHAADAQRRQLQAELRSAFSVPLDAEDLFVLSERLDDLINGAKNAIREAEVMQMAPDAHLGAMAQELCDGVRHIAAAFETIVSDPDQALEAADAIIKCQRNIERDYRQAMSDAIKLDDLRELFGRRELYRRYARLGDGLNTVAERIWYAVVKQG